MKNFLRILIVVFISIEIYLNNSAYIMEIQASGNFEKGGYYGIHGLIHSLTLLAILKLFLPHKKDSFLLKLSFLFFLILMFFGCFRVLINLFDLSNFETWVIFITRIYHLLRSPNVFAIIIPLLIVRKQMKSTPSEI